MPNVIPLSQPDITDLEIRAVTETLKSGRLSQGERLEQFEEMVADCAGRRFGIGVSSGTAGLHLALLALGVGPGDEVITPAFSFVASANCALFVGAKPVFVDCDPKTLNVRPADVEKLITEKTKAIIGVEVFGNPAGMDELAALSTKHEIPLIEDGCEGLGGRSAAGPIGSFGQVAVFAFYPNKQITTGEGGMIVTHDDHLAELCRSLRNQGRPTKSSPNTLSGGPSGGFSGGGGLGSWLAHERLGYNFRLDELSAALGVAQMKRLGEILAARQQVANLYMQRLMDQSDLMLPTVEPETYMSWFVYVVRLSDRFTPDDRDQIIAGLRRHDIGASNYFPPIPLQPYYREFYSYKPGDFPMAESVSQRTLALPFFTGMTENDVDLVCQTLELMMTRATFSRS